jgi:GH15 family glucan-1,4-alpha-glucosidase
MEGYLAYILNIVAGSDGAALQPVYGIDGRAALDERVVASLPGYRGIGPVRIGNQAWQQVQHDAYGAAILAATHVFFDQRLTRRGDEGCSAGWPPATGRDPSPA